MSDYLKKWFLKDGLTKENVIAHAKVIESHEIDTFKRYYLFPSIFFSKWDEPFKITVY